VVLFQNDEKCFRDFVFAFVENWENQLGLEWVHFPTVEDSKGDEGPHLSKLSEDLLSAIGRFLISSSHNSKVRTQFFVISSHFCLQNLL